MKLGAFTPFAMSRPESCSNRRADDHVRRRRLRNLALSASGLVLAGLVPGLAQAAEGAAAAPAKSDDISEVVVNGVPYKETVLPTRLPAESTYGLNLSVMDTPRSATLLSATQLQTVNLTDPRAFSYLTSSSYTDSAFGTPNIPRVRTQYADVYYNGMRDSFTENGYGVPVNFDALANISITKGPASVYNGAGPGVGGQVDFLTKRPNMLKPTTLIEGTLDSVSHHRLLIDVGGPIIRGDLGVLISYSGEDSGSYFYGHYMHKSAVYAAVRWQPNDKYKLDFNTEANIEQYTENVGVNRANQALIDHGLYLQGGTGDPSLNFGFGSTITLAATPVKINPRITIDETPGTSGRSKLYNAQLIQSYAFTDHLTLENNTLFMWQDSDNQALYYYADNSNGTYSLESKTSLKGDFDLNLAGFTFNNKFVTGGTFRFAHTNYISNFNNEAVSIWDLTTNPSSWALDPFGQTFGNASPYKSVFGRIQYGVPGRDFVGGGNTGVSDLYNFGLFFQDRIELSPQLSALFGARIDSLQDHTHDPLGCTPEASGPTGTCAIGAPGIFNDHTTGVYGLGQANVSVVYKITPNISSYVTFNWTQSPPNPNGGEGGINVYGFASESGLLRGNNYLYEGGFKFDLFNKKLFASISGFDQKHYVPVGAGNTSSAAADTRGVELEFNYQPTRSLFATASYSYIDTVLNTAPSFYDFPATPGVAVDGAGIVTVFKSGQHFQDPGQPQHVLNFLGNYKFDNGFGLRSGLQVTGPIPLTPSGYIDQAASLAKVPIDFPVAAFGDLSGTIGSQISRVTNGAGYYKSPSIPWQYTWNLAAFYENGPYTFTFSVYNVTDRKNWAPSLPFYGTDFLVLQDPRTFEVKLQAKF